MSILKSDYYAHSVGHSGFSAEIIMPSIWKFLPVDIHDGIIELRVLNVVSLVVHSNNYNVMSSFIPVPIRSWIVLWLENLNKHNHRVSILNMFLQLLHSHVLFFVKREYVFKISFRAAK